jgi:thioredoxin 1
MSKTVEVTNQNFKEEVINSKIPVLVDFWAPWCGPCLMMAPVLDEISEKYEGKIRIAKLNTEVPENQSLAYEYQIMSIPNMKLFENGKVTKELIGFRPKEILEEEIREFVK